MANDVEESNESATRIQAIFRGRQTRKKAARPPNVPRPPRPGGVRMPSTKLTQEEIAAIKIQSLFRGKRARRKKLSPHKPPLPPGGIKPPSQCNPMELKQLKESNTSLLEEVKTLRNKVEFKQATIVELNDTANAFQITVAKLKEDLQTKEFHLSMKTEKVDVLSEKLNDREVELGLKEREVKHLQTRINMLQIELDDLKEEAEKEGEEFTVLEEALQAKDQELNKKTGELIDVKNVLITEQKELDRLKVILRRQDKEIKDRTPETADACLSARSFKENQLIQLRDESIQAKSKEVWLLSGQNDKLRVELDNMEQEMAELQQDLIEKDMKHEKQMHLMDKMKKDLHALRVIEQQSNGREQAMEIATTQNSKLLQCLQEQETRTEELQSKSSSYFQEINDQASKVNSLLEKTTLLELDNEKLRKELEQLNGKYDYKKQTNRSTNSKAIQNQENSRKEIEEIRFKCRVEVEKVREELYSRRNKQYELTFKLQECDRLRHEAQDACEGMKEELQALRSRMGEMEALLVEARVWRDETSKALEDSNKTLAAKCNEFKVSLDQSNLEKNGLHSQVKEMKKTILGKIDVLDKCQLTMVDLEKQLKKKEDNCNELKNRVSRLVDEMNQEKKKNAHLEMEQKIILDQQNLIRHQTQQSIEEYVKSARESKLKYTKLFGELKFIQEEFDSEKNGKFRILEKYIHHFQMWQKQSLMKGTPGENEYFLFDFGFCRITNMDLNPIIKFFSGNNNTKEKDGSMLNKCNACELILRGNLIDDDGIPALCLLFQTSLENLSFSLLDLRGNFLSFSGIRNIAKALERKYATRSFEIFVKAEGKIEVLDISKCETSLLQANSEAQYYEKAEVVLTIDARGNNPNKLENCEKKGKLISTASPLSVGKIRPKRNSKYCKSSDPVVEEIYGADLVKDFFKQEKPKRIRRVQIQYSNSDDNNSSRTNTNFESDKSAPDSSNPVSPLIKNDQTASLPNLPHSSRKEN